MLLDTSSNHNRVAFTGMSKKLGKNIFIDGKKDIIKILEETKPSNTYVGQLPPVIFDALDPKKRPEQIKDIYKTFEEVSDTIRDFKPSITAPADEYKNRRPKEAVDKLKNLFVKHGVIKENDPFDITYLGAGEYKKALDSYNSCITHEKDVKDDLELVTNFNYKAAFCNVELGNYDEAVKHLNKTIDMLNEKGRLDKNLEDIYQKCSFEKDRLMYKNNVEDKRFSNFKFLSTKTSITALIIIIIAYIILKIIGY